MKELYLIRHAKSSWKFPDLEDHERPLNKRGKRDALAMARYFSEQGHAVEVIYSSTAIRALEYAELLADFSAVALEPDLSFYTFDDDQLLEILFHLPAHLQRTAIVGHNPAITELVNRLSNADLVNVPTSAIVSITADVDEWTQLNSANCRFNFMQTPKLLRATL